MTMMQNHRLFRFGARATQASWRSLMARFCGRADRLSSYAGTMQFSPRFIFVRLPSRWQAQPGAQARDRFVDRQTRREVLWRQPTSVMRAVRQPLREVGSQRTTSTEKTLAVSAAAGIGLLRQQRTATPSGRIGRPAALYATPLLRIVRVETETIRHVRQARGPLSSVASARFIMRRVDQIAPALSRERQRTPVMRETHAWRARVDPQLKHAPVRLTHRSPAPVVGRHVGATLNRVAASVKNRSYSPRLWHVRPLRILRPRSRATPHVSNRESTRSPSNALGRRGQHDRILMRFDRGRSVASGASPAHRPISPARAMQAWRSIHSGVAKSAGATSRIPPGIAQVAAITDPSRRNDRNVVTIFGARLVRRAASARRQRLAFPRHRRPLAGNDVMISRASGAPGHSLPLIVRQRAALNGLREQTAAAPRRAYMAREPRRISAPLPPPSEQTQVGSQRIPPVEEVRRILIPLLKETLFSEGTMGRLTDGVVTGVERRHSVEHYRKTGGR
jgi:hypothetical protein